jgi:adenosylcobinamide amidohydrolase
MVVRFSEPRMCVSWAIINGGRKIAPAVAWYFLQPDEYPELVDPRAFLRTKLEGAGVSDAVGMITSRKRYGQVERAAEYSGVRASCVATLGLRNTMRIGDPPTFVKAGTINLVCSVSENLTEECSLEALAMAAEARTAAMMDGETGGTGTGTDCLVIAHPTTGEPVEYAGKHTVLGHVIGRAVYDAVLQAVKEWQRDHRP